MVTRRDLLVTGTALAASVGIAPTTLAAEAPFVRRSGTGFLRGGTRYRYAGANMWYAPWLGAQTSWGNRDRLRRELDRLAAIGVTNLRIAASAEDSPLTNSVKPAFRTRSNAWNPALLDGLDYCLAEMAARDMTAVLYLTNFWEWSGGMMTYLYWVNGGRYINMNDPTHPWPEFPDMTAQFYGRADAVAMYHDYVRAIVGRHANNPTVMAWQLANEPRPGGTDAPARANLPAFYGWIRSTAQLIKRLAPNHLVSTGSEGLKGSLEAPAIYKAAHAAPEIDYCTAHIWPLNWSWVDAKDIAATHAGALEKVADYIARHVLMAGELGKPLVIEEFGYPRDGCGYDPESSTHFKDAYYRLIYESVEASMASGGPIAGSNFWAWNGEGRAVWGNHRFRPGDTAWLGDPPHEPQGWYGVFDTDTTTQVVKAHAAAVKAITG